MLAGVIDITKIPNTFVFGIGGGEGGFEVWQSRF